MEQRLLALSVVSVLALVATACTSAPPREVTPSPTRGERTDGATIAQIAADGAPAGFVLALEDLVSDENGLALVRDALAGNSSLAELRYAGNAERLSSRGAARAALLPDASVDGHAERSNVGVSTVDGSFETENEFGVSATAGWNLDVWGNGMRDYRATRLRNAATELETRRHHETHACRVLEEWVTYIYWDEVLQLQGRRYSILCDLEELTAERFARGVGSVDERSAALSERLAVEALLDGYQLERSAVLFALASDVGASHEEILRRVHDPPLLADSVASLAGTVEGDPVLSGSRLDILADEVLIEAARLDRRNAAFSGFPQLRVEASASRADEQMDDLFGSRVTYQGQAAVTVPLFNGGQRVSSYRAALERQAAAETLAAGRRATVRNDLAMLRTADGLYERQIETLRRAVDVADDVVVTYRERYDRGQVSLQDLLRAEENRVTVDMDLLEALRDRALHRIAYARSYGLQIQLPH